jgi:Integrase core domain.
MTIHIDTKHQVFWLSYEYFQKYNISENTISQWSKRKVCKYKYIDGRAFINYDTIPEPTRKKLPSKEEMKEYRNRERKSLGENFFYKQLKEAYSSKNMIKWQRTIRETYSKFPLDKATTYARRASVFEKAVELHNDYKFSGEFSALYYAFNRVLENTYTHKPRFLMALKRAKEEGILSVSVDARALREYEPVFGDEHKALAESVIGHAKGYIMEVCYERFTEACFALKWDTPSPSWFEKYYYKNKNRIERSRYGESVYQQEHGNYAKIIPALYSGDQWQMDGWRVPVYCKKLNSKDGFDYFIRYDLFVVMDAHSRKIIGFDMAESENTETILKALEMAVKDTGVLPYEIVADNHSFNRTKEAEYLKAETDRLGLTWTIDSNPRRKAILERAFRTLGEHHFKDYYGYIGQGVKSKIKNGRTPQELMDKYTTPDKMLTYEQVYAIVCAVIKDYNNKVKKSLKESPIERYSKSEQPNSISVSMFTRIALFNRKSEYKVSHGQITIKRGQYTYEYQLPSEYSVQYNGKQVGVCYSDFSEIYLYDLETNEPICSVCQKSEIHGALANQTEKDIEFLHKNAGRIEGNNSKMRKKKESLFDAASNISPDYYEVANKVTASKDVLEKARTDLDVRNMLAEKNINADTINQLPVVDEMLDNKKPKKKENNHPFSIKGNETAKINIDL